MLDEVGELRREIEMLRSQNAQLMAGLDAIERRIASDSASTDQRVERRQALRMLGGLAPAGVGAAAVGLSGAQPAAANVGDALEEGPNAPATPYVVNAALSDAVLQITNSANGAALYIGAGSQDALVVDGSAKLADVVADDIVAPTIRNTVNGFAGAAVVGFDARATGTAVSAEGGSRGVDASGLIAVRAYGTGYGNVLASSIGLEASGEKANARFPSSSPGAPWVNKEPHTQLPLIFVGGELVVDSSGAWWVCVQPGSTAESWRMVAAPESAGAYVPIVPQRFYDSRISGNRLAADQERVVDLPATLPEGVRAVHVNVTVCNTVGAGYLAIFPTDTLWPGTSTVNWFADNQFVANAITVKTDGKHLTLRAGTNATNIVLDLYGYYR